MSLNAEYNIDKVTIKECVDFVWYQWGDELLEKAEEFGGIEYVLLEDMPVSFVSFSIKMLRPQPEFMIDLMIDDYETNSI